MLDFLEGRTVLKREFFLPLIALLIIGMSLLTLSSVAEPGLLSKQLLGLVLGAVGFLFLHSLGRGRLYSLTTAIYLIALVLLLLTMVIGVEIKGNRNWLGRGFIQFQPLEFGKIALILMLARYMKEPIRSLRDYVPIAIISLPMLGLTLVGTKDLGGTLVLCAIVFGMMIVRSLPLSHVLIGFTLAAIAFPTIIWPRLEPYQQRRLTIFLNPAQDPLNSGYQVIQSMIAIGSGGVTGKGYRSGTQSQLGYLPERQNDFVFAALAEEQGFVGAAALLLLYTLLFWRIAALGFSCPSSRDRLVIGGIMAMLGFQVLENVGATLGLAPLTGLTLPLVSSGASSLVAVILSLGIVSIVHRDRFRSV